MSVTVYWVSKSSDMWLAKIFFTDNHTAAHNPFNYYIDFFSDGFQKKYLNFPLMVQTYPANTLNGKTAQKCFKSPKMNFKVSLFVHLYKTPYSSWYPHSDSPQGEWWSGLGGSIMEKKQVCFKMHFKTYFFMENLVIKDPHSQLNEIFH